MVWVRLVVLGAMAMMGRTGSVLAVGPDLVVVVVDVSLTDSVTVSATSPWAWGAATVAFPVPCRIGAAGNHNISLYYAKYLALPIFCRRWTTDY